MEKEENEGKSIAKSPRCQGKSTYGSGEVWEGEGGREKRKEEKLRHLYRNLSSETRKFLSVQGRKGEDGKGEEEPDHLTGRDSDVN